MKKYLPRLVDAELQRGLQVSGGVEIRGPRACGKTETARQAVLSANGSEIRLDLPGAELELLRMDPRQIMAGASPRLIDEWQVVPEVWNLVRHEIDDRGERGQFILTGSATPDELSNRHSGAGRIRQLVMRTMTLSERGLAEPQLSLSALISGTAMPGGKVEASVSQYADWMAAGGWPGFLGLAPVDAAAEVRAYLQQIVEHDYPVVGGNRRDPRRFQAFLAAYAGLVGQPASFAAIGRRMGEVFGSEPSERLIPKLHDFAVRLNLIEDQPAWTPKLRSRASLIQTPKRHFADVSLALALLNATPKRILTDLETLGFLFESLVVHDLRVLAGASQARGVFHLRDNKSRFEIDAIVEAEDGSWAGLEVKLSHLEVDKAAANLLSVAQQIAVPPSVLAVIIPSGPVVRRADGVWVIPLAALGV